ncbi:aldose epimerase family protein [Cellulomonas hominis]
MIQPSAPVVPAAVGAIGVPVGRWPGGVIATDAVEPQAAVPGPRLPTVLRSDVWQVGVLPATGGALTHGRVLVDGTWRDLLRPTGPAGFLAAERCASFPLVPWSNRIVDGVLPFRGRRWRLSRNAADGTAIHGAGLGYPWRVDAQSPTRLDLSLDSRALIGVNFPWRFRATVSYALHGPSLTVGTTLENVDDEPFPAGFGHHPYFRRSLETWHEERTARPHGRPAAASASGAHLQVPAGRGYALDRAVAVGPSGAIPPHADYTDLRPVGAEFVNDVLTRLTPGEPVRIVYPESGVEVLVDLDEIYSHVVVYVPRNRASFAVEPVTHVNGGFALHDAGVRGTGVFVLEPGERRAGSFRMTVRV